KISAFYYWIFPNTMFNFYPWGVSINVVRPVKPDLSKVSFLCYVWDEFRLDKGAGAGLDKVEREDEAIVENVQRGINSKLYNHGRYSVKRETGTHHFHRLIAEFIS
ncbi:MAG: SRPBCC family protein, partial [bacterium]